MAGDHRHVDAFMGSDGHDQLADRSRPYDQYRLSCLQPCLVKGVERDRRRLDQRSVGQPEASRKRDQAPWLDPDLIRQAAINRQAVHPVEDLAAQLILTGRAAFAPTARNGGLDGHRRPVLELTCELVTQGAGQPERE
jgi:hypothetical protein